MKLLWSMPQQIAEELFDTYPDVDPLTLNFVKFHELIVNLEGFADDPEKSNEKILEAILMAWIAERD